MVRAVSSDRMEFQDGAADGPAGAVGDARAGGWVFLALAERFLVGVAGGLANRALHRVSAGGERFVVDRDAGVRVAVAVGCGARGGS